MLLQKCCKSLVASLTTLVIPLHEIQQSLHSKSVFCRNISNGRSNQKNSKNKVVLFSNFASGRTLPTQSTGPQPIQLVPKHLFLQISLYRSLKSKNFKKTVVVLFSNFASGRTLPTQPIGPQPIQLVPKHKSYEMTLCKWSSLTLVTS